MRSHDRALFCNRICTRLKAPVKRGTIKNQSNTAERACENEGRALRMSRQSVFVNAIQANATLFLMTPIELSYSFHNMCGSS